MISVVDITKIDIATKEDISNQRDLWAKLFKANNWEDLKMLAAKNGIFTDVVAKIVELSVDEKFRMRCRLRISILQSYVDSMNLNKIPVSMQIGHE